MSDIYTNYKESLIPHMTSDTAPSGKVLHDGFPQSFAGVTYSAWRLFTKGGITWIKDRDTGFVGYQFDDPTLVNMYSIRSGVDFITRSPNSWTFEGSLDGLSWQVLDRVTNKNWVLNENQNFDFLNKVKYTYYRMNISKNNGGGNYLQLASLKMFEKIIKKSLLKSSAKIYNLDELKNGLKDITTSIVDVNNITVDEYELYGIDDLSGIAKLDLDSLSDFRVLQYTNEEDKPALELEVEPYTLLDELTDPKLLIYSENANPILKIKAIPKPQLIRPIDDIQFKMLDKINTMTLTSNKTGEGVVKMVFSVDSGVTWKTYNSETLEFEDMDVTSLENVKSNGIDADTFNTIASKWNEVVKDGKIRFAYYLEIKNEDDIANVDRLEINMDLTGRWKKAMHGTDYDYEYDNEHIYVTFNTDGSYKVNYTE